MFTMLRVIFLVLPVLYPFASVSAYGGADCDPELFKGVVSEQISDDQRLYFLVLWIASITMK